MHIAVKRKTITRDRKINYSKKRANIKYYNYKTKIYYSKEQENIKYYNANFFFFFFKTYAYLINKLKHIK